MKTLCTFNKTNWKSWNSTKSLKFGTTFTSIKSSNELNKDQNPKLDSLKSTRLNGFKGSSTKSNFNFTNFNSTKTSYLNRRTNSSDNILINCNYFKSLNRISQNRDVKTMMKHIVIINFFIKCIESN